MTTPPQSPSSLQPVSLDERKFEREAVDKKHEFDLREREVAAKEKELQQSRWSNPLVIGLFAAALGLAGNIWVEHANNKWAKDAERSKAQSTLILEAIKTGDSDKACKNLLFFVRLGLISEGGETIKSECLTAPQGPPSLPANSGSVTPNNEAATCDSMLAFVFDNNDGGRISKATVSIEMGTFVKQMRGTGEGQYELELPSAVPPHTPVVLTVEAIGYKPATFRSECAAPKYLRMISK